jgi:FkbM family methyltransferase
MISALRSFSAMAREVGLGRTLTGAARLMAWRFADYRGGGRRDLGPQPASGESLTTIESHGAVFAARAGSCDAGIIAETWQSYMCWIEEVGIDTSEVVLDLGAHIGGFSLHLAAGPRPPRRIYALEPEPANFALLQANVARNGRERIITAIPAAAYRCDGAARLRLSADNSGGHHITFGQRGKRLQIETRDIRAIVDSSDGRISLMKIDVEGWEFPILRRLGDRLGRVDAIIGEAHTNYFCTPHSLFRYLRYVGFAVRSRGPADMPLFLATRQL